ncbi:MAG TPA: hypothetical protein VI548_03315 [Chitinophagaceae bacterium]|nr:hypothetical protein [Chitinophagaceae bacterium]
MIGLFKQKTPVNILFVFILGILIKLPLFKNTVPAPVNEQSALFYKEIISFLNSFGSNSANLYAGLTYLILFTQAMQLNKLMNDHRMMQKMTFLPAIAYMVITSMIPEWNFFSPIILINSLILVVFSSLFKLYNQSNVKSNIFNIGLAIGLCSFIFFPSLILVLWLLFALMIMRTVRLNEWLICLLGVTTPFYFYAAYLFLTNALSLESLFSSIQVSVTIPGRSLWLAISSFLLVIPFLIGGYLVQDNLRKMLIQVRKNWSLVLIFLLFALFIPFVNNETSGFENWIMAAIPFAAFHACTYLYTTQRWLPAVIFWISILFIITFQYAGPGWG